MAVSGMATNAKEETGCQRKIESIGQIKSKLTPTGISDIVTSLIIWDGLY